MENLSICYPGYCEKEILSRWKRWRNSSQGEIEDTSDLSNMTDTKVNNKICGSPKTGYINVLFYRSNINSDSSTTEVKKNHFNHFTSKIAKLLHFCMVLCKQLRVEDNDDGQEV